MSVTETSRTESSRTVIASSGEGSLDDERALTERARTDRDAFAQLYRRHVNAVYGYAYRQCGSREAAEEATSATFERALRAIGSFEWRGGGVRPWLFRITSNEVAEIYRRQSRASRPRGQLALRDLAPDAHGIDAHSHLDGGVDAALLHQAIATLHPRYREAVSLRYLAGLTSDEAASALGCSKAVLAVTLHRGLGALRKAMSTHLEAEEA